VSTYAFEVFADYHQFALLAEQADGDLSDSWTQEAVDRLLAVAPGVVGIGTISNVTVPVVIEIAGEAPEAKWDAWDHVVEASLELPSGRLVVLGGADYFPVAPRISVAPGTYRVRSHVASGQQSDAELSTGEHYRVVLWPAPSSDVHVLKQAPPSVLFPGT
jgi:hypothetical protein